MTISLSDVCSGLGASLSSLLSNLKVNRLIANWYKGALWRSSRPCAVRLHTGWRHRHHRSRGVIDQPGKTTASIPTCVPLFRLRFQCHHLSRARTIGDYRPHRLLRVIDSLVRNVGWNPNDVARVHHNRLAAHHIFKRP